MSCTHLASDVFHPFGKQFRVNASCILKFATYATGVGLLGLYPLERDKMRSFEALVDLSTESDSHLRKSYIHPGPFILQVYNGVYLQGYHAGARPRSDDQTHHVTS